MEICRKHSCSLQGRAAMVRGLLFRKRSAQRSGSIQPAAASRACNGSRALEISSLPAAAVGRESASPARESDGLQAWLPCLSFIHVEGQQ